MITQNYFLKIKFKLKKKLAYILIILLYKTSFLIKNYATFIISIFVKCGLKPTFLVYLFLDFILKTLTFSPLNCSKTLNSIFEPSTIGVPTFVSLPSSSDISKASVEDFFHTSNANFLTSIISPFLTVN